MQPKRLIVILLVVALALFGALAVSAAGDSELAITVEVGNAGSTDVQPGDTVAVSVTIDQNPGLLAGTFKLQYDPAVMQPVMAGGDVSYNKGAAFAADSAINFNVYRQDSNNLVVIAVMNNNIPNRFTTEGVVATVYFKILETDACVDAAITLADVDSSFGVSDVVVNDDNTVVSSHTYGEATTFSATCTQPAKSVKVCQAEGCGHKLEVITGAPLNHDYVAETTKATCDSEGFTTYTCSRNCGEEGHTYVGDYVGKTSHEYKLVGEADATCDSIGYQNFACINCDHTYTAVVAPALGHTYTKEETLPTCTTMGYTTYTCACGDTYKADYVDALGHTDVEVVTAPTCTDEGYTTFTCSVCGDSYVCDYRDALGHTYVGVETKPTCTAMGYTTYTCSVEGCDASYVADEKAALLHTYTKVDTAATCTTMGYSTYTCTCGDTYKADYVDAKGHTYTKAETAATCTTMGYTTYTCACGDTYKADYVDAKGHTYTSAVTAPTCTTMGYTTYTCACGDTYKADYVDAKGHTAEIIPAVDPTYSKKGSTEGEKCSVCGTILTATKDVAEKSTAWIWILVIVCVVVIGGVVVAIIFLKKKEMWFFKKK